MFHRWAARVLVLALCAIPAKYAAGQATSQQPRGHGALGRIGSNYPNPFNPDTHIAFAVGPDGCVPGSGQYVVTMQLLNVLAQPVVEPQLATPAGATASYIPNGLKGQPIHGLTLPCGDYEGYWDGHIRGREAPSGVYAAVLTVGGEVQWTKKIFYKK